MAKTFDPYYQWLGIPPADQPPSHYRLLAISMLEDDPDVISAAVEQRLTYVRTFQVGEHADDAQRILDELSAAKICLLGEESRTRYTATLRGGRGDVARQAASARAGNLEIASEPPPVAAPPPAAASSRQSAAPSALPVRQAATSVAPAAAPAPKRRTIPTIHLLGLASLILVLLITVVLLQRHLNTRSQQVAGPSPTELPEADGKQSLAGKTVVIPEGVVAQDEQGFVSLAAGKASVGGQPVAVQDGAIVDWTQDQPVEWELLVSEPGIFMIEVTYAADAAASGGTASIKLNDRSVSFYVRDTGGWQNFVTDETKMVAIRRGGRYTLVVTPQEMPSGTLAYLKSIRLRPAAIKTDL